RYTCSYFFTQAEDGIRDFHVTGVQTCALPICGLILNLMPCVLPVISIKLFGLIKHKNLPRGRLITHNLSYTAGVISTFLALGGRSEERRVCNGCGGGCWGYQIQKEVT